MRLPLFHTVVPLRYAAVKGADRWVTVFLNCNSFVCTNRSIRLYAFAQDRTPVCFQDRNVDVTQSGLTAHSAWYDMSTITGIDFMVQAVIVAQPACIEALHDAVRQIETHNHNEFAFVCHGATHRSVACCILLAQLVYPYAQVCLSTRRTQQAAADYNLY